VVLDGPARREPAGRRTADAASRTVLRGDEGAPSFAAFHLDAENHVVGATGVNAPRECVPRSR